MADSKITALTSISTSTDPANDPLVIVDVSDTSMAASGTTKKVTLNQLLGASGTATLASATITGDLTVDTSTLVVTSSQDRVGIGFSGNASAGRLQISQPLGSTIDGALRITDNATTSFVFNNVSSGVSGIWSSGAIAFGVGSGTFTEAMRLNSTGLGVGASPSHRLTVSGTAATNTTGLGLIGTTTGYNRVLINNTSGGGQFGVEGSSGGNLCVGSTAYSTVVGSYQNYSLHFITNNNVQATIDSSGNVGIGVTPSAWSGTKALQIGSGSAVSDVAGDFHATANAYNTTTGWVYISNAAATDYYQRLGAHVWRTTGAGTGAITWTQAMTLDASGNLLVGDTAQVAAEKLQVNQTVTNAWAVTMRSVTRGWLNRQSDANGGYAAYFEVGASNTNVGSIATTSSGTSFVTTSDYRLKESVQPLVGGLARVSALKPSIYKWKVDGSSGEGFLAHELAEVVPFAVTGEKDAVNEDGSIKPQGVDLSKVVPVLVAAIQELAARVQTLETR